jgi:L-ascorbate metabolism protein UlaG (beta-lactamase superfamily)
MSQSSLTERGRISRTAAAVRSTIRRYPQEIVASLLESGNQYPRPMRELLSELSADGLATCWLGHASVAMGFGALTCVVDPVLSDRIGPRLAAKTIGLKRLTPSPIGPESIRGLDAILITHAHFDHLDRPTLEQLVDPLTTVIVPKGCRRLVPRGFANTIESVPGCTINLHSATIEVHQPRHWGARTLVDRWRASCAYVVRHADGSVLLAGDTADTRDFKGITPLDLAVFGIGAYEPWEHMHATPEQAWRMYLETGAKYLLPVHHSTFELSDEPFDDPLRRLFIAAGSNIEKIVHDKLGAVTIIPSENH